MIDYLLLLKLISNRPHTYIYIVSSIENRMKKFFLKGKEFLSKKLQQLDLATESIDFVNEQIPNRLREPLRVLQRGQIDLESNEQYEAYFRKHPTHHLSKFLLEKYQMLIEANSPTPLFSLPQSQESQVFVPSFDKELENKALLFREVVEEYDEGYTKVEEPILCMAVIHFHHKRGTQIQYRYPQNKTVEGIENLIVHHAMPDSSHNKNQDYNFFNFQANIKGKNKMLFGVSYFKQIKVTEAMKEQNKEVTRSYIQKAVTVISSLPLFGYLKMRLSSTTKVFFDDFSNFEIIDAAYKELSKNILETWPNMSLNELYIGSDLKVIINLFGVAEFYEIWKAILYQKRVVVFAHSSSSASSFILSLLTLFPGLAPFGLYSKPISKHMQALREYALPLRLFSDQNFMAMSFHIQDFHLLARFQKSSKGSFLIGTTNRLLKEANDYGIEMLVNLQNCTIEKKKSRLSWEAPTKREKMFIADLQQIIETEKSLSYGGSEDMIRNHFHRFLKLQLIDIMKGIQAFRKFRQDCREYEKASQSKGSQGSNNNGKKKPSKESEEYEEMEDEETYATGYTSTQGGDFPPLIPQEVTSIPFPNLLLSQSFSYFLQFHNQQLPLSLNDQLFPTVIVEGAEYYLKLSPQQFVIYNWNDKKLDFGKGKPKNYEGKEIKFMHDGEEVKIKHIFIGVVEGNRFSKNGYFIDRNQTYEGDYSKGVREGYGKLSNSLHKYIGYFQNDLYAGQGQLLAGKEIYVGEFREGMKHGCGKSQGEFNYDGEWLNNRAEGSGVMKKEGREFIGYFTKGYLNEEAEVTIRYENGSMYKGFVKELAPDGRGYLVDENGVFKSGIFSKGELVMEMEKAVDKESLQPSAEVAKQLQDTVAKVEEEVDVSHKQKQQQQQLTQKTEKSSDYSELKDEA